MRTHDHNPSSFASHPLPGFSASRSDGRRIRGDPEADSRPARQGMERGTDSRSPGLCAVRTSTPKQYARLGEAGCGPKRLFLPMPSCSGLCGASTRQDERHAGCAGPPKRRDSGLDFSRRGNPANSSAPGPILWGGPLKAKCPGCGSRWAQHSHSLRRPFTTASRCRLKYGPIWARPDRTSPQERMADAKGSMDSTGIIAAPLIAGAAALWWRG